MRLSPRDLEHVNCSDSKPERPGQRGKMGSQKRENGGIAEPDQIEADREAEKSHRNEGMSACERVPD